MRQPADGWREQALAEARVRNIDATEIDYLIEAVTGLDRLQVRLGGPQALEAHREKLCALWRRRIEEAMPLQYLLGTAHWRDLQLQVNPAVLIPRPETEALVDIAVDFCRSCAGARVVDLGTGSGAIAVAVARALPAVTVWAVDASEAALAVAAANVGRYGLSERVHLLRGDWFAPLPTQPFDAVLSNPPYIPSTEIAALMPEVRLHEPLSALDGGADGLDAVRQIIADAARHLRPGGILALEVMVGQAPTVVQLLARDSRYGCTRTVRDWAGIERIVVTYAWARGS
ncbi:peptide chain release factor N(5)-glutamine methyltransferase [Gloeobacter morelensis]|uniref:Release factor glutamine methyltransferase n=1 Tax=Gloeobacter morelensis MG652769 TaxID=2781736 RepID=A0ABY3PRW4_9CYAN|nr:peptide chain release factor N(5)-glutamine methyltransferase [Gloeobacter morelensis]UFP96187.1 peptide chain release factor N(5)-glutamine methyltransferase [Gloeobacter morelensis MG652769]